MKKYLFLAVTAIVALASCSDNSLVGEGVVVPVENELTPITFSSTSAVTTRGDYEGEAAANKLNKKFIVGGFKGATGTSTVFDDNGAITTEGVPATDKVYDNYQVQWTSNTANTTTSNTNDWEYVGYPFLAPSSLVNTQDVKQSVKYWDYSADQYDFIAYSTSDATVVTGSTAPAAGQVHVTAIDAANAGKAANGAYKLTGDAAGLAKCYIADMVTAYRSDEDFQKTVQFKFRSLSSKVRIGLYETVPGYSVKDVVFYTDASTPSTDKKAHLFTTGSTDKIFEKGTYTVYFPTIGSDNKSGKPDYNKAHLKFTAASEGGSASVKEFGVFKATEVDAAFVTAGGQEAAGKVYLSRSSSAPTYAGTTAGNYYTIVLPNEDGAVLNLKVNYTLLATDGSGEVINVTGATAKVPAQYAQWKSGYAYTYLFKISENTNGKTNPDIDVTGLYPITFDAVVMNDEVDGTQETITTVSEPSITTFGYDATNKKYISSTNDYAAGNDIYVTIMDDGSVVVPTPHHNFHLYRNIVSSDANYPITEETVKDAIEVPTANKKITFTHPCNEANSWFDTHCIAVTSVPGEDGNAKTVNAVKLTGLTAGTYAVQYRKSATEAVEDTYTAVDATEFVAGTTPVDTYYTLGAFTAATGTYSAAAGITYYEYDGTSHNYKVKADLAEDADVTSYYVFGGDTYTAVTAGDTYSSGITYYSKTDGTALSAGNNYYKIIIVH